MINTSKQSGMAPSDTEGAVVGPRRPVIKFLRRVLADKRKEGRFISTSGKLEDIIDVEPNGIDTGIEKIIERLASAKQQILISAYIFDQKSEIGLQLIEALREKQKSNPDFKIYITTNKTLTRNKKKFVKFIADQGINADVSLHPVSHLRGSLHTKLYVIDSEVVYTGGDNIDNPHEADLLVGLSGDVVNVAIDQFQRDFNKGLKVRVRDGQFSRINDNLQLQEKIMRRNSSPAKNTIAIGVIDKHASKNCGGSSENNLGNQAIKQLFKNAHNQISLVTPNFNDLSVWDTLVQQAAKGVEVEILLPKNKNNFAAYVDCASNRAIVATHNRLPEQLRSKIKIKWYTDSNGRLLINHSKAIFIDDHTAYIGSHNLDNQSRRHSAEWGVVLENRLVTKRLKAVVFDQKWKDSVLASTPPWLRKLPKPETGLLNRVIRVSMTLALIVDIAMDKRIPHK